MSNLNPLRVYENEVVAEAKLIKSKAESTKIKQKLEDEKNNYQERYHAYLVYFSYNRRMKNIQECIDLYNQYKNTFGDEFLIAHFYSIVIKNTETKSAIAKSIQVARQCVERESTHSGALHNLAGSLLLFVAHIREDAEQSKALLIEALEIANEAIKLEPDYPKFYATRASINASLKFFEHAENDITKAIEMEDSGSNDYSIRLTDYLAIKTDVKFKKEIQHSLERSQSEIEEITQDARKSNLEILSFFIAVISFIIGGLSMQKQMAVEDATKLILVLSGALIVTISGFCLLFDSRDKFKRFSLSLAVAIFLFVVARFSDVLFFG